LLLSSWSPQGEGQGAVWERDGDVITYAAAEARLQRESVLAVS
jgi:hypothetical protein